MNKFLTTAAVFITLTTSAAADPVTSFLDGIFGGHAQASVQQQQQQHTQQRGRGRHARTGTINYNSNWTANFGGHYDKIGRAHV